MKYLTLAVFALLLAAPSVSLAEDKNDSEYVLVIKNHKFSPETLEIPEGKKVKITVDNQDASPEEFESHELNREKVIPGNSKGVIFVGPLKPGTYPFVGEFNMATAKGQIVVK